MGEPDDEAVLPFFYRYWFVSLLVFSLGHCPAGKYTGGAGTLPERSGTA